MTGRYTLVKTYVDTGETTVWGTDHAQEVMRFLSTCRPRQVRQAYIGTRQVGRVERFNPEIIDAECVETGVVRFGAALAGVAIIKLDGVNKW